jgi:hypothetical protein
MLLAVSARAQETFTPLSYVKMSTTTEAKPQSKVWQHDARWWAVLPSTTVTPTGTWLWRLGTDAKWTNVLRLSSSTTARADIKPVGELAHVLLYDTAPSLVSLEYDSTQQTYVPWVVRPTATPVSLSGSETATIDVDSTGRMWLAYDSSSNVLLRYSDFPYSSFQGPISLATNIKSDDITVVVAMPVPAPARIGVLWSNQNTQRFGFRTHVDGADPLIWSPDEVPASQSALQVGLGMADDHLNVKVGTDGTLYAAVKTSYDTPGFPAVSLLVRRPLGTWDDLYFVDADGGTRGLVLVNEPADLLRVVFAADSSMAGDVVYRDSLISAINFGPRHTLMTGSLRNPTGPKSLWTDEVVVLASGHGVLIRRTLPPSTTTSTSTTTTTTSTSTSTTSLPSTTTTTHTTTTASTTTLPSTTTTLAPSTTTSTTIPPAPTSTTTSTTTTTTSSTTSTTVPGAVTTLEVRVAASADDAEEAIGTGKVTLNSPDLEMIHDASDQVVGMRFVGLAIPPGATIVTAWIQFTVDETDGGTPTLTLAGAATDNAPAFTTATGNVSTRPRTTATATWRPPSWSVVGQAGPGQQTPELKTVIGEVVGQPGWTSGNALAIIVTGTGKRVAVAWDLNPAVAPLLHVEYTLG